MTTDTDRRQVPDRRAEPFQWISNLSDAELDHWADKLAGMVANRNLDRLDLANCATLLDLVFTEQRRRILAR